VGVCNADIGCGAKTLRWASVHECSLIAPGDAGAIRVSSGDLDGLSPKWKRGSGRWVRNVLVWSKAPLMLRKARRVTSVAGLPFATVLV
jgi:hypothetical protein